MILLFLMACFELEWEKDINKVQEETEHCEVITHTDWNRPACWRERDWRRFCEFVECKSNWEQNFEKDE